MKEPIKRWEDLTPEQREAVRKWFENTCRLLCDALAVQFRTMVAWLERVAMILEEERRKP